MKTELSEKINPVIICGTDFTPGAGRAADTAAALARCLDAPLELVHARMIRAYPPMNDELRAEADRLRQQGTDVHESMLDGDGQADEELVKLAIPKSCRLVVVSSLGKRAPQRWLLGSVSETLWLRLEPASHHPFDLKVERVVSCLVQVVGFRGGTRPPRPIHIQRIASDENELRHDSQTLHRT